MHTFKFYDNITLNINDEDWEFLCKNRLFTDSPAYEDIRAEFVSGTGITPNKSHLWEKSDELFHKYIEELREIQKF